MRPGGGRLRRPARTLVWQLVREQRWWLVAAVSVSGIAFVVQIALGQAAVAVIDQGVTDRSADLGTLVIRMGALGVTQVTTAALGVLFMTRMRWQIEYRVRTVLHRSLLAGAVGDEDTTTGQVVTRAVADLGQLNKVVYLVPVFVAGVPAVLSGMAYLGYLDFPLMLVTFSSLPVNLWLVRKIRSRIGALSWLQLQETAEVTRAIDEPIRGIRVVKLFGREPDVIASVRRAALHAYRYALTRVRVLARYGAGLNLVPALSQAALLLLGARAIEGGRLTTGEFLVFFVGSGQVVFFARSFVSILDNWAFAKTGSSRIGELVDPEGVGVGNRMAADDRATEAAHPFGAPVLGWAAEHVVLAGPGVRTAPASFAVRPGEVTVLRVPSGLSLAAAGEVLAGQAAPVHGSVWLEERELHEAGDAAGRAVRVLDSEPYLFARSVRDNLRLGAGAGDIATPAADEALAGALHAACADEVVATLPGGLDEVLGDRAMNLSGGQRQRLALAQALLARPRVLVLLEALSGVHGPMEAEILARIRAFTPETAVLYCTTRPAAAAVADHEVVLEEVAPGHDAEGDNPVAGVLDGALDDAEEAQRAAFEASALAVVDEDPRAETGAEDDPRPPTVGNLARPLRRLLPVTTALLLLLTVVGLAPQYLFGQVNDAIEAGNGDTDRFAWMLVGLAVVGAGAQWIFDIQAARLTHGMLYLLRTRLVRRLSRLGLAYYDRELPGYVATRVLHDLDEITTFAGAVATRLAVVALTLVAAVAAMALVGSQIVLLILGVCLTAAVITLVQVPIARRAYLRQRAALGDVIARLEEDYNGRGAIDAAAAAGEATASFDELADRLRRADRWTAVVNSGYSMAIQWVAEIGGALIMWRAGELVIGGLLSLGAMLTVRLYLARVMQPMIELGTMWQQYLRAKVSFDRLRQPYEADVLPVEAPDAVDCEHLGGDITLTGVRFRYPGTEPVVLDDVDLTLAEGETVALIGPTGAGKSTLAKLVTRVYDPDDGTVAVGGQDLRRFTTASLRRRIGVVPQEPFLFRGTVATNIAYGRPDAGRSEIEAAVAAVGAGDGLARLPRGLDSPVVEEGINLTPQERQLVALARAWLVEPDILVLDEATSSLDEQTELDVLLALERRGGTTIFVTHRDQVAAAADRRLIVDGSGPHDAEDRPAPAPVA